MIDKKEIEEVEQRLLEAMKHCNVDALNELLHKDLLFIIPTGQTVNKEVDIQNLKSGNLKIDQISSSEQDISIIDDNAVVSVIIDLKGLFLEQPIYGKFKYIRTWKKIDNQWFVIGGAGIQM